MKRSEPRHRASVACDSCRKRRRKCDGQGSGCANCRRFGVTCNYSPPADRRTRLSRAHMNALEYKIHLLEERLKKYEGEQSPAESVDETSSSNQNGQDSSAQTNGGGILEKMDIYGKLNVGEDGQQRMYGPRSSISFITEKVDMVTRPPWTVEMEAMDSANTLNKLYDIDADVCDELLSYFWAYQNSSVMFVNRHLFMRDMLSRPQGKYYSLSLLSAMLAVGARFAISQRQDMILTGETPETAGLRYANLANFLLNYEKECPSVKTVQVAGILAMYNMFIDREMLAWDLCGMAIRLSLGLGLSIKLNNWIPAGIDDQDEVEEEEEDQVHRLTWWGCYVLEKLVCNILGRPVAIKKFNITSTFPTESCISDYDTWGSLFSNPKYAPFDPHVLDQPCHLLSSTTFTIELYMICDEPLNQLHLAFRPQPKSQLEKIINDATLEITEFEASLPSSMKLGTACWTHLPHVYMFNLRLNHVMILMHRVLFLREYKEPANLENEDIYQRTCRIHADNISRIIIEFTAKYPVGLMDFAAPECISSAAMIHLYLLRGQDPRIKEKAKRSFDICYKCLKDMSSINLWARRLTKVLTILAVEWDIH